jgi:hypothetical protein
MSDTSGSTPSLEDLWTRLMAGQVLDAEQRSALVTGVEQNEVFRRRALQDWQMHHALLAAAGAEDGRAPLVARVTAAARRTGGARRPLRPRDTSAAAWRAAHAHHRRWSASRALAAAAAVVGALCLVLVWPGADHRRLPGPAGAPVASLSAVEGRVTVHTARGAIVLGAVPMALGAGDAISTVGPAARATVAFGQGPRLELGPDGSLTVLAGKREAHGLLFHGELAAAGTAGPSEPPILHLDTPHATVLGRGRLVLRVSPQQTAVEVSEGQARVTTTGTARESVLRPGESTVVRPGPPIRGGAGPAPEALLLVAVGEGGGPATLADSDRLFKSRLENLGFAVRVVDAGSASEDELRQARVVVLSFTLTAADLPASFQNLPIPIVAVESSAFTQLHFTGPRWMKDVGNGPRLTDVVITNPEHPLAAGLTGAVRVFSHPQRLRWAAPPETASPVASYAGAPEGNSLVFAYERGDLTAAGRAPARRAGLFLGNERVVRALNEQGWRLFDAAVSWCASQPR